MEFWAPQWPPQPRGRPTAPAKDPNRGLWRDGIHQPVPHSWHNGERYHQWQDTHGSPPSQQDPRTDHQQPRYVSRPGERHHPPVSGVDYYEGGYPRQLYSRPGMEDLYRSYHSSTVREEYAYGNYYYHGHPQQLQEEREGAVPRGESPYIWQEDHRDQKYLSEQHHDNQNSLSRGQNPYKDSAASNRGQERPGDLVPERLLPGTQKNKPPLADESNLLRQHESGLSSSAYELSQYIGNASEMYEPRAPAAWSPVQAEDVSAAGPKEPMKFYIPHVPVSFGPGGQLVCVGPSSPRDGQTALVELHSMEVILNYSEEQEELRTFSGPLIREDVHKVDIMTFCQHKAAQSLKSETERSRDSALLWQLLVLLCRQNGSMVGSDIAELLMQDCKKLEKYKRQPPVANLINLTDEDWPVLSSGTPNLLTGEIPPSVETPAQIIEKFTKLLYYGRKKEALEWAMKNHLWGHALFLSSKMDPRTYNWVMSGFTSTLAANDPLQTLFQFMSARIPQAATCCADKQWGDWRPHLAVILSNQGGDPELLQRAIITMGDTLAGKGLVEAAHFCYLMAHVPFGHYTVKTDHLALLGSNHSQEFSKFATTEAIQRTEIFEYCQMLGRPKSFIPSFQVYKLLYASRLADYGLVSQALHYCEAIGTALLSQEESNHPVLLGELIKLAERLKLSDPLVVERRHGDRDPEPAWLVPLRRRCEELAHKVAGDTGDLRSAHSDTSGARGMAAGGSVGQTGVPVPLYSVPGTGGSLAVTGTPGGGAWEETQQIYPPVGENTVSQGSFQHPDSQNVVSQPQVPAIPRSRNNSESSTVSVKEDGEESSDEADKKSSQSPAQKEKPGDEKENTKSSGFGWFSWFRSKPTDNASASGEHSSDSPDSEETSRASSLPEAGPGFTLTSLPEPQSLPGTLSGATGEGQVRGSASCGGAAEGTGSEGLSGPEAVSSELYFNPGVLLPPTPLKGSVPLYNPSQVPQLSMVSSLNRPNRLAQRRYPTQR
ncbi:protein transport protein Sec16B isoform X3 [Zalophus californianus]|uniref:Protein transport protein sec16 n=1 Tax=Zalophus californianus TaxID=9704 RepID=A0A6J2EAV0_ZALCA|nr:protein transport protein Sec16B isoform X3 [Zalophus californianus]